MARILAFFVVSFLGSFLDPFAPAQAHAESRHRFHVVIDPGHGGADFGTVAVNGGVRYSEKEMTLLLAQQTAAQLRARGISADLTRTEDKDLALGPRTEMANRLKADIFISIHMNSTQTPMITDAEGVETYILNNTTEASSKSLARLENSVLGPDERQGDTDVALILRDLRLDANLSESKRLACLVQQQVVAVGQRSSPHAISTRNRGIRQALFHVLLGAEMPSILVEAGFLNNAHDRDLILDPRSRRMLASAIARAVENFRDTKNTDIAAETLSRCKVR
ncbi:MAG: N-acetylmuramoyl-L-alanine amidase [Oligoflexia bacterium]|nr:N-acetylmuramoyl-L-alanine amidase [Oligoflexia bacterium]